MQLLGPNPELHHDPQSPPALTVDSLIKINDRRVTKEKTARISKTFLINYMWTLIVSKRWAVV